MERKNNVEDLLYPDEDNVLNDQYYWPVIWLLKELVRTILGGAWYWWVQKVTSYPEFSISVILFGLLFLIFMSIKRRIRVTVIEGDEIKNLIKAIYKK